MASSSEGAVVRNAHVVNRVNDLFDLFGIDDFGGQVIVYLRVSEVTLLLAERDELLELRLALLGKSERTTLREREDLAAFIRGRL
jgi:hypothetical protein